jgi:hypothetical protein
MIFRPWYAVRSATADLRTVFLMSALVLGLGNAAGAVDMVTTPDSQNPTGTTAATPAGGTAAPSPSTNGAPPIPAKFVVKPVTITRMGLMWAPAGGQVVDGQPVAPAQPIDGYHVEESIDGKTFTKVTDLPSTAIFYNFSDLKPATAYWFRVGAYNAHGVTYTPAIEASTIGEGSGLTGHYYTWGGPNTPNEPKYNRVDPYIDFDWVQLASTDPNVDAHNFMVVWTGQIQPLYSETYTFYVSSDDGDRLWVDGKNLIDNWKDHPAVDDTATMDLEAGKKYDIRLTYYENNDGPASIQFKWSSPSQPKQVILPCQLYPKTADQETAAAEEAAARAKLHAAKPKAHAAGHKLTHRKSTGR